MKGIIEHDDCGSPCCIACDFHGVLYGLSATIEEECLLGEVAGGDSDETFRQIDIWLVHHHTKAGMGEFLCLLDGSLCHFWACMPNVHGADAACKVDEAISINIFYDGSLSFRRKHAHRRANTPCNKLLSSCHKLL